MSNNFIKIYLLQVNIYHRPVPGNDLSILISCLKFE